VGQFILSRMNYSKLQEKRRKDLKDYYMLIITIIIKEKNIYTQSLFSRNLVSVWNKRLNTWLANIYPFCQQTSSTVQKRVISKKMSTRS
jgi:hypothetical protein